MSPRCIRPGALKPDPELWAAMDEGRRLTEILEDFYTRVYADPQLAPFFEDTSPEWIRRKQYSFLRSKFTGEDIYFGYRPRNAHHAMVISDAVFDHRAELMRRCLHDAGLSLPLVERWMAYEEVFRRQIVKSAPVPLKLGGVEQPLEGYEAMIVEVGSLCDGCERPVDEGASVRFHVRTGKLYCGPCMVVRDRDGPSGP